MECGAILFITGIARIAIQNQTPWLNLAPTGKITFRSHCIEVQFIPTENILADNLTKVVSGNKHSQSVPQKCSLLNLDFI